MKITYRQLSQLMADIDASTLRRLNGAPDIDVARTEDGRLLDPEQRAILLRLDKDVMKRWHAITDQISENVAETRGLLDEVLQELDVDPKASTVMEVAEAFARLDPATRETWTEKYERIQSGLRADGILREQTVYDDERVPA